MTFLQAIAYFVREAAINLLRGWKVSILAILTIGVSLFLAGTFLLVSSNLRQVIEGWRGESKVIIYLETGTETDLTEGILQSVEQAPWTLAIQKVSSDDAQERFQRAFPSMAGLLESWGEDALPSSLEIKIDWQNALNSKDLDTWLEDLRTHPGVLMVDDDQDWLGQLATVVFAIEGLGLVIGVILLVTAVFTISSIIRLTAYLYRDEIAVMRMVGATEFFIRGPFYAEGLLQGLAGGLLAVGTLLGIHTVLQQDNTSFVYSLLANNFLSHLQLLMIMFFGGLAGLIGAIFSLGRESLGAQPDGSATVWKADPEETEEEA